MGRDDKEMRRWQSWAVDGWIAGRTANRSLFCPPLLQALVHDHDPRYVTVCPRIRDVDVEAFAERGKLRPRVADPEVVLAMLLPISATTLTNSIQNTCSLLI